MRLLNKLKNQKEAEKWYKENKAGLKRLALHPDYVTLEEYWQLEYEKVDNEIDTLKGEELELAVAKRGVIRRYKAFIDNMLE